jgi:hypothetical protein
MAVTAAVIAFGAHLKLRLENVRLGYDLSAAHNEERSLLEMRRVLSLEVATLSEPERVEMLARAMNMELAQPNQLVTMLGGPPAQAMLGRMR